MKSRRFLAGLLCLSMLSSQFSVIHAQDTYSETTEEHDHDRENESEAPVEKSQSKNEAFQISFKDEDGSEQVVTNQSVSLPFDEKRDLVSNVTENIQWQIQVPGSDWVNVSGANGNVLSISRPLIENLLDSNRTAHIRVTQITDTQIQYSGSVSVVLQDKEPEEETEPSLSVENPVIVEESKVTDLTPAPEEVPQPDEVPQPEKTPVEPPVEESQPDVDTPVVEHPEVTPENVPGDTNNPEQIEESVLTDSEYESAVEDVVLPYRNENIFRLNEGETLPPAPEKVNFIIQYLFRDGKEAAQSKVLTVNKGESLYQRVDSPVVLGFETKTPYVEFSLPEVTEGKTIQVYYDPSNVGFKVQIYHQHLEDDEYDLIQEDLLPGFTGSKVEEEIEKNNYSSMYPGFSLLNYENADIAADGSTVIRLYYDRNYYLMMFSLDGGWGDNVEPIYARYESPTSVGTPVKTGYTFSHWTKDGQTATVPGTMPAANTTFTAVWTPEQKARVTYIFWGEDPDLVSVDGTVTPSNEYSYLTTAYKELDVNSTVGFKHGEVLDYGLICDLEQHVHTDFCYKDHVHEMKCYPGAAEWGWLESFTPDTSATQNGQVVNGKVWGLPPITTKGIYINDQYYKYTGGGSVGSIISPTCNNEKELVCGKDEHKHTDECYGSFDTLEKFSNNLWKLNKADTGIVNADGSTVVNVYFERTEFTMNFYNKNPGSNPTPLASITATWGSKIRERFLKICSEEKEWSWSTKSSGAGPWTCCVDLMPSETANYYKSGNSGQEQTAHYYLQNIIGDDYSLSFSVTAKSDSSLYVTEQDRFPIEGFTLNTADSTALKESYNNANFKYYRNSYNIVFSNLKSDITDSYKYEADISGAGFIPGADQIPIQYEPGSVEFAGWYQNERGTGEPYNFDGKTMPSKHILLYAKWVPKEYTVTFRLNEKDKPDDTATQKVLHGSTIKPVETPVNGSYIFDNWFYRDEQGVEHPFHPDMPVKQNLDLYAKWNSDIRVDYTLKYYYEDPVTKEKVYIADDRTVNGLNGTEDTFYAKADDEFYSEYRGDGYFPVTSSHTVKFDAESLEEKIFEFQYVKAPDVEFTIHYYRQGTTDTVHPTVQGRTSKILETFDAPYVANMRATRQSQQKVMSTNPKENVIIFEYVDDIENSPYRIIHMVQNAEGEDYTQYTDPIENYGKRGESIEISTLESEWFEFTRAKAEVETTDSGEPISKPVEIVDGKGIVKLDEDGYRTTITIYYDRIPIPYTIRYRLKDSDDQTPDLTDSVTGMQRYGSRLNETSKNIPGYVCETPSQSLALTNKDGHEIVFYYVEDKAHIQYKAVGPEGEEFGEVDPKSEVVDVFSGNVEGSTATAKPGYKFIGWFSDEECTKKITSDLYGDGTKFIPQKDKEYVRTLNNQQITTPGYQNATYYAKFEKNTGKLKITKTISGAESSNKVFRFSVKRDIGAATPIDIVVSISTANTGGSIILTDLPEGNYIVEELTGWYGSEYEVDNETQTVTVEGQKTADVSFTNTKRPNKWFKNSDSVRNTFNGKQVQ